MRLTVIMLLASVIISCNSKSHVMSQDEFAHAYLEALKTKHPAVGIMWWRFRTGT